MTLLHKRSRRRTRPLLRALLLVALTVGLLLTAQPAGAEAPSNGQPPTVSGDAVVGATLTAETGRWSGTPIPTYAFAWEVQTANGNWPQIAGADQPTYVVQPVDEGLKLRVRVTATNSLGSAEINSNETAPVVQQSTPVTPPDGPNDALGTPRNSRVVSADQLLVTQNANAMQPVQDVGTSYDTQLVVPDVSGNVTAPPTFDADFGLNHENRVDAEPPYLSGSITTTGRFADQNTDGVLGLQVQDGNDLVVSSTGVSAQDEEVGAGAAPYVGRVIGFTGHGVIAQGTGAVVTAVGDQGGSTTSWWYSMADPGGSDAVQLVNLATGLCLAVPGAGDPVVTEPCDLTAPIAARQLVAITTAPRDRVTLTAQGGSLALTSVGRAVTAQATNPADINQGWIPLQRASDVGRQSSVSGGTVPTWRHPLSRSIVRSSIAAGDLDRAAPESDDEQYHDEAVVAWTDEDGQLGLAVLDYAAQHDRVQATVIDPDSTASETQDVAVGDFNGDGVNEIALLLIDGNGDQQVSFYSYLSDARGVRTLTRMTETPIPAIPSPSDTEQVSAADLDGDGRDDLALAMRDQVSVLSFTSDLEVRGSASRTYTTTPNSWFNANGAVENQRATRLAAGLFRFDPDSGYDLDRRQLAVAWSEWNTPRNSVSTYAATFSVDYDPSSCDQDACSLSIAPLSQAGGSTPLHTVSISDDQNLPFLPLSLAAGGFRGRGDTGDVPLWGLAVSYSDNLGEDFTAGNPAESHLAMLAPQTDGTMKTLSDTVVPASAGAPYGPLFHTLTAIDAAGASLVLGAPTVADVEHLAKASVIAQQAPSHADWFPQLNQNAGGFYNLTRYSDFTVDLGSNQNTQYQHSWSSKTGWSAGVTASAKVSQSFKGDLGLFSGKASFDTTTKFSKRWSGSSKDFTNYSTTIGTSIDQQTGDDDLIQGQFVSATVYRYPILGGVLKNDDGSNVTDPACQTACYGVYEIVVPGPVVDLNGAGRSLDFWNPSYQNGNVLSYPRSDDSGAPTTGTLGSYSYVKPDGSTATLTQPLFSRAISVGRTASQVEFDLTSQVGSGNTTTTGNNWKLSEDFKATADWKEGPPTLQAETKASVSIGANGGQSINTVNTGNTINSSASKFRLTVPQIDGDKGYQIGTTYYYDTNGVARVAMAADVTTDEGASWWRSNYFTPDPALNLPKATFVTTDQYNNYINVRASASFDRQEIRGFRALHVPDPTNPTVTDWTTTPVPGDQVVFTVPIHNYSLSAVSNVPVVFYAVPVGLDDFGNQVPQAAPVQIGSTTIASIPAQGMQTVATSPWTAKVLNGDVGQRDWRIFVQIDPSGTIKNETHPFTGAAPCPSAWIDPVPGKGTTTPDGFLIDPLTGKKSVQDCGQNNQGWGQITVGSAAAARAVAARAQRLERTSAVSLRAADLPSAGVQFTAGGMITENPDHLVLGADEQARVRLRQNVTGIAYFSAATDSVENQPVLVYDGTPEDGTLIASTTLRGVSARGGGSARYQWRPTTPGLHTLTLKLLGSRDAGDDDQITIKVLVEPPTSVVVQSPKVVQARCVAGKPTKPSVTAARTTGLTYTVRGKVAVGQKVTVTASAETGYVIDPKLPSGWVGQTNGDATYEVALTKPTCGPGDGGGGSGGGGSGGGSGGGGSGGGGSGGPSAGPGDGLANTGGAPLGILIGALALIAAGGGLLLSRRFRRPS